MSARKKSSKSASKKQEGSTTSNKNAQLLKFLQQRLAYQPKPTDNANLTALILESLLEKDVKTLDSLLSKWSHDRSTISLVISNILQSKITLFVSKIIQIATSSQNKDYVYPWLAQIISIYPNKISESVRGRLLSVQPAEDKQIKQLMKLKGKLMLVLQQ